MMQRRLLELIVEMSTSQPMPIALLTIREVLFLTYGMIRYIPQENWTLLIMIRARRTLITMLPPISILDSMAV